MWENEVHLKKVDPTMCLSDLMSEENLTSIQFIVDTLSNYLLVGGKEVTMSLFDMLK